jgi:hypothetical protein
VLASIQAKGGGGSARASAGRALLLDGAWRWSPTDSAGVDLHFVKMNEFTIRTLNDPRLPGSVPSVIGVEEVHAIGFVASGPESPDGTGTALSSPLPQAHENEPKRTTIADEGNTDMATSPPLPGP